MKSIFLTLSLAPTKYRAFGYDGLSIEEAQHMYADARMMDEQHNWEFTGKEADCMKTAV